MRYLDLQAQVDKQEFTVAKKVTPQTRPSRYNKKPLGTIKQEPRTAHTRALENKRASRHKQIPHDAKKYLTAQLTIDN